VQKREKRKKHLHGHPPKLENVKMEVGEEAMRLVHAKRPNSRGQINFATSIYKNVIMPLRIKKIPLLGLKCWPSHLDGVENDVAMM